MLLCSHTAPAVAAHIVMPPGLVLPALPAEPSPAPVVDGAVAAFEVALGGVLVVTAPVSLRHPDAGPSDAIKSSSLLFEHTCPADNRQLLSIAATRGRTVDRWFVHRDLHVLYMGASSSFSVIPCRSVLELYFALRRRQRQRSGMSHKRQQG